MLLTTKEVQESKKVYSYNRYPHKWFEHFKETELRKAVFIVLHTGIHWIVLNWISFTSNDCKVQLVV